VEGFPTIKYFGSNYPSDGEKYEDAREFNALSKFVKKNSKKPCQALTGENCGKKDKAYMEEIKDFDQATLKSTLDSLTKEIDDLDTEHNTAKDLFEKQKDEAMATMKVVEELKKKLSKQQSKSAYKIAILKAMSGAQKGQEL